MRATLRTGTVVAVAVAVGLPAMGAADSRSVTQEPSRDAVLEAARAIMIAAENCALVTLGVDGRPQARMMNPFAPEEDLSVWMATNPGTRKVAEIRADERVTLIYFDPADPGYVTLLGDVRLIDDADERRARWKDEWNLYYPGGPLDDDYLLMEFVPTRVEVVSVKFGIADDPQAWKPAIVEMGGS